MFEQNRHRELRAVVLASPLLAPILRNWGRIGLPDGWLVAGAIAQTVWNIAFGLDPEYGILDIDIVYFDESDLSQEAEAEHSARIRSIFVDLPVRIDIKNEARVHLWYERKFGYPIAPYGSVAEAISTFPTTAAAVGVRPNDDLLAICAPFGLADLLAPVVRANKKQITREIYEMKVSRWLSLWPALNVIPWDPPRTA